MEISIEQARALCMTVDCNGYTQASIKLNKSHSALIYSIKSLEEQCGFSVFNRKGYRNTLTPFGKRIYLKCLEIIEKVGELEALCGQYNEGQEANLKIVFDGILPFAPFLELYKKFRAEKKSTIVQTYTDFLEGVERSYDYLNADIMISILPVEKQNLTATFLKPMKMYLVAHKEHPIHKEMRRWSSAELEKHDFLTIRGSGKILGLSTYDFEKSASFFLSDFSNKKEAIAKKTGFGWLPQHLIERELRNKIFLPIRWERDSLYTFRPILYSKSSKLLGPSARLAVDSLQSM